MACVAASCFPLQRSINLGLQPESDLLGREVLDERLKDRKLLAHRVRVHGAQPLMTYKGHQPHSVGFGTPRSSQELRGGELELPTRLENFSGGRKLWGLVLGGSHCAGGH